MQEHNREKLKLAENGPCSVLTTWVTHMIEQHGHFRVLDQLANTIAEIANIYSPKSVIDPCCEDIAILEKFVFAKKRRAIFRNPSALRDAEAKKTEIICELGDITKTSPEAVFDAVVTIVPFGVRDRTDGQTRFMDVLVAERCLGLVASDGICILVVPQAFLTAQRLSEFRRRLSTLAIDAIIEIPPRALSDLTAIQSAMIVVRRGKPNQCGVFMGAYQPDHGSTIVKGLRDGVGEFYVARDEIMDRWTRNFQDPKYQAIRADLDRHGARPLGDFGEIKVGSIAQRSAYQEQGEYLVLTGRHIRQAPIIASKRDRFVDRTDEAWFKKCIVEPGDVVFSLIHPAVYVYKKTDPPAIAGETVAVLQTRDNEYVSTYLNTPDGKRLFESQALSVGSALHGDVRVSVAALREIRIPVLPLEELNTVSDAAIATASPDELEALRQELKQTKLALETTREELARKHQSDQGPILKSLQFLKIQTVKLLKQQQVANAKLDHLVSLIGKIIVDIGDIKKGSRGDEEKLARICQKLDALTEDVTDDFRTIQEYAAVVQTWLDQWNLLDALTRKFLPSAEQLYDILEKQEGADFSPFIIQYCRALENEILTKLFCAYHDDIQKRIPDLKSFVASDILIDNTKQFAKSVHKDDRKYTLGGMNFTMQLIKLEGTTLKSSPLLQDFRRFVISYFRESIAEKEFLEKLDNIIKEFRNKAAHPYLMSKVEADKCLLAIREALCELLDAYRTDKILGEITDS